MMAALLLGLSALAALLQAVLPLRWSPVDLALLVTVFAGLRRGGGLGFFCGATAGLLLDALASPVPGLRLAPLAIVGALADSVEGGVNREQPRLQVLAVAGLCLLHDALLAVLGRHFHLDQGGVGRVLGSYVLPRVLAQGALAVPLFWVLGLLVRQRVFQDPLRRPVRSIQRW
jgi:rod shape-determining protein MreD